jgi:hypothetical protein
MKRVIQMTLEELPRRLNASKAEKELAKRDTKQVGEDSNSVEGLGFNSMQKDKVVYSTERDVEAEKDIEAIKRKIEHAQDRLDPDVYSDILILDLGLNPASKSYRQRMAAFRRSCNLD